MQGLLHISEMGWSRVSDASHVVQPGDEITVKVLRLDDDRQKISLGLKQLSDDPWSKVPATYEVGQVRAGRITRAAPFGVLVELEPGIEGLVPLSETGVARDADVKRAFSIGADVRVVVLEIDADARRIRLSMTAVDQVKEAEDVRAYAERTESDAGDRLGSLAEKLRGALSRREGRDR